MTDAVVTRSDVDIRQDVLKVFHTYPPLAHDRHRMEVVVEGAVVSASGNVRTAQALEVFAREASKVPGVIKVNTKDLHDDETLRLEIGRLIPLDVRAVVTYGVIVLTGQAPAARSLKSLTNKLEKIAGVRKVVPNFN